jgi:hypothetical protein
MQRFSIPTVAAVATFGILAFATPQSAEAVSSVRPGVDEAVLYGSTAASSAVEPVDYYWRGARYPYRWRGGYYAYRWHGGYYRHRRWWHGYWRYY